MEPHPRFELRSAEYETAALPIKLKGQNLVPREGFEPSSSGLEGPTSSTDRGKLVRPERFELPTPGFVDQCSYPVVLWADKFGLTDGNRTRAMRITTSDSTIELLPT